MPTGYTSGVYEGKVTDAKEFVLTCARAFGATIMMRDEPLDVPIPEFQVNTFHKDELDKYTKRLEELKTMANEEIEHQIEIEYRRQVKQYQETYNRILEQSQRYSNMIEKIMEWEPPTSEHHNLKDFCLKQLFDSMNHDCKGIDRHSPDKVEKQTPKEWLKGKIEGCEWSIEYHNKHWKEELSRTGERNLWIKQLKESFEN